MKQSSFYFSNRLLPFFLIFPQIAITFIFFVWPATQAILQSFYIEDPFGLSKQFAGLKNFETLWMDPSYLECVIYTFIFSFVVAGMALSIALWLAVLCDRLIRRQFGTKTMLIVPYAIAPAVAGVLWGYMFYPGQGMLSYGLTQLGIEWNFLSNPNQAFLLIVLAATWKQVSYNFVFFLAGLAAIPPSLIEAAKMDGAGPIKRFWTIVFPLLSPTTFFLVIVNIVYAFFDTFGIIHTLTEGGPARSTETMVYRVWYDGFQANQFGLSSAQSVILIVLVGLLTLVQFKFVERRVHY